MSISPVPRYSFRKITDISPVFLNKLGIRFLMLDLDNTIAAYSEHLPSDGIIRWAEEIKNGGIELFIVSNSVRKDRVEVFAEALGIGYIKGARKPSRTGVRSAMASAGYNEDESALAGDQVYTDSLAAKRAGIVSIIVMPRRFTNLFLALRYAFESPFRALSKNKMWRFAGE